MRKSIWILGLILCPMMLFSLGAYNLFNGRNHPELDWNFLESEHIQLVYHSPLETIAEEALHISEASYAALAESYQTEPNHKILVYISNQDKIPNGATVFDHYIFIYVNQNDYLHYFSGNDKFLPKVIAHEMSHYFLFTSISDWLAMALPMISASSFPIDINEGYAQFFSGEEWGLNRGDRYLRNAVFSNELALKPELIQNGGVMYARGFAMVRYLYGFYGEEKLRELLKYRNDMKLYNFREAFQEVYGKSFEKFQEEWQRYIYTHYFGETWYQREQLANADSVTAKDYSLQAVKEITVAFHDISPMVLHGNQALFLGRKNDKQRFNELFYGIVSPDSLAKGLLHFDELKSLRKGNGFSQIALSENGAFAAFSQYKRHEHGSIIPTVFVMHVQTGKTQEIGKGNYPQVFNDGRVVFHKHSMDGSQIVSWQNGQKQLWQEYPRKHNIGELVLSPNEEKLAINQFDENNQFVTSIFDITSQTITYQTNWECYPQKIVWQNEDTFFVQVPNASRQTVLHQISLQQKQEVAAFAAPPFHIFPLQIDWKNNQLKVLSFCELSRVKPVLGTIHLQPVSDASPIAIADDHFAFWKDLQWPYPVDVKEANQPDILKRGKYAAWKFIRPRMFLPFPTSHSLLVNTMFTEPLGKHFITAIGEVPYQKDYNAHYYFDYTNKCFAPTLSFSHFYTGWHNGYEEDHDYSQRIRALAFHATLPNDWITASFWQLNHGLMVSYVDVESSSREDLYLEEGYLTSIGFASKLRYNLPYKNDWVHPIRQWTLDYSLTGATQKWDMGQSFWLHDVKSKLSWAPLFDVIDNALLQTITLQQETAWRKLNGNTFVQNMPAVDGEQIFSILDDPFFRRSYIRGFGQVQVGDQLFSAQNEIWLKLVDQLKLGVFWGSPLLEIGYLGIGGWYDYAQLWNDNVSSDFSSYGPEIKTGFHVSGIPLIGVYGRAYDESGKDLGEYYQIRLQVPGMF